MDAGEDAAFEVFTQVDLSAFFLGRRDLDFHRRVPDFVDALVIMEDRAPDFFLTYRENDGGTVPLSRHGPSFDQWKPRDVRRLVDMAHAAGKRVFIGAWMHTSAWVFQNHPELLLVNREGEAWTREGDLNPMRTLRGGDEDGIPFDRYVEGQYARLSRDFGFDGLFIGDGGLGFRQFGHDFRGLAWFDFAPAWIRRFREAGARRHEGHCPLEDLPANAGPRDVARCADHILEGHGEEWVEWNAKSWADFYHRLALGVHAVGGELMTYNVMNYGPVLAALHGADYRAIAEAGVDYLVFQTYDFAWGRRTTPLHAPSLSGKELEENQGELLMTRARLGDSDTKLFFTTEVGDRVEGWKAPPAHTIGEVHAYGDLSWLGEEGWRRVADGTVVTWANRLLPSDWSLLQSAYHRVARPPREPGGLTLTWDEASMNEAVARLWRKEEPYAYAYQLPGREKAAKEGTFVQSIAPAERANEVEGPTAPALPAEAEIREAERRMQPFEGLLELRPIGGTEAPRWAWRLQR